MLVNELVGKTVHAETSSHLGFPLDSGSSCMFSMR